MAEATREAGGLDGSRRLHGVQHDRNDPIGGISHSGGHRFGGRRQRSTSLRSNGRTSIQRANPVPANYIQARWQDTTRFRFSSSCCETCCKTSRFSVFHPPNDKRHEPASPCLSVTPEIAGDGTRTHDVQLGKQARLFSHLLAISLIAPITNRCHKDLPAWNGHLEVIQWSSGSHPRAAFWLQEWLRARPREA